MVTVEAAKNSLSRHGGPEQYKWQRLTGMFVRGHRRRFGNKSVPGRVIWRRDSHIRGGERFDDGRDVPRSVVAARFAKQDHHDFDYLERARDLEWRSWLEDTWDARELISRTSVSVGWEPVANRVFKPLKVFLDNPESTPIQTNSNHF